MSANIMWFAELALLPQQCRVMDTRAPTSPENPYSDDFKPGPSEG
jgi:hypothetical protein